MSMVRPDVKWAGYGGTMDRTNRSAESYADLEQRIRNEIMPLFEAIIRGDHSFYVNRNAKECWNAIDSDPCRCRAVAETTRHQDYLGPVSLIEQFNGESVRPHGTCVHCDVYKDVCPTIVEEIGEAFNRVMHILSNKEAAIEDAASLTRELAHSLEDRNQQNQEIIERMSIDSVTGVSNRQFMNEKLLEAVDRCHNRRRILSLIMLDVDDFKSYNDSLGHVEGDRVLALLGRHLLDSLREYDQAFRYGGEEFLIMLPDTDAQDALMVAERIRTGFADFGFKYPVAERDQTKARALTLSGGLVTYRNGMGVVELLERADQALYKAKHNGKNKIEVDEIMTCV